MIKEELIDYLLSLADDALILGHRNSEWCGHGPVLEQDIAITNISLDLIGQARYFYQYAAELINGSRKDRDKLTDKRINGTSQINGSTDQRINVSEDSLAYLRDVRELKNCLLVEQPNGDWAKTILRQFFFSAYQYYLYTQLQNCSNEQLAAIAEKSLKEVTYHLRWSCEWVIRLGDGTDESRTRILKAVDELWMYTSEVFQVISYQLSVMDEFNIDIDLIRSEWENKVKEVFDEATLSYPSTIFQHTGGRQGNHSEHLGYILADMQFLQRAYPGCDW